MYNSDEPAWLIPKLQSNNSPGTTLGNWLRALRPSSRGGTADYRDSAVPSLPDRVTAGGIQPGASNMLNKYMLGELAVHVTVHDLKGTSALYEYVDASRALAMQGGAPLGPN